MDVATTSRTRWTPEVIADRIVRYNALQPCYNAFIDTRSPGSEAKENFTIIGPGVSENPDQHVHIAEPHGFNIGGARQPPGCINSQHSHDTAEVFVIHSGIWRFNIGEFGNDAQVVCRAGDVISLPTGMFRGFTNIGAASGFLWAVLGGDDPGRVLWAPQVFDMAADHGLVLLENGALIDTVAGQRVPNNVAPMPRTTAAQVAALRVPTGVEAESLVVRAVLMDAMIIGPGAPLNWCHGFTLERIVIDGPRALRFAGSVIFVQQGQLLLAIADERVVLAPGDTMTLTDDMPVSIIDGLATVFQVRRVV
jgi:quercetin dioxygenase-like cupin family protein